MIILDTLIKSQPAEVFISVKQTHVILGAIISPPSIKTISSLLGPFLSLYTLYLMVNSWLNSLLQSKKKLLINEIKTDKFLLSLNLFKITKYPFI